MASRSPIAYRKERTSDSPHRTTFKGTVFGKPDFHWFLAVRLDFEKIGFQIQTHKPGLLFVEPRARGNLVFVMFCFDQSVKCGHTSKQPKRQSIFPGLVTTKKRITNENRIFRKIDIPADSMSHVRISWFYDEILHRWVRILHTRFYAVKVYQIEISNKIWWISYDVHGTVFVLLLVDSVTFTCQMDCSENYLWFLFEW